MRQLLFPLLLGTSFAREEFFTRDSSFEDLFLKISLDRDNFVFLNKVEVELEEGTLIGYQTTGKHFEVFKQVPYAKSPEGNLRFRKPEPIGTFAGGIHDSVAVGDNLKACIGTGVGSNDLQDALDTGFISEDCLTMDIYRPVKNYHTSLPIFVWIHGGGLTSGTSAYYHFSRLAREDIIVAVVQYRLGVHGFLSSYSPEGLTETPGNFGLLDQQAAIEFVHRNARNLGGDPEKITIGGESAGGWSVGWHMLSTKSTNMIRTAISQSGMASFDMSPQDSEHGNLAIKHLCEKTKAKINSTLACSGSSEDILNRFRTLNKNEIIQLEIADRESRKEFENYPEWAPVHYDGEFFKMNAKEEFEGGHIVDDVTYVIGSNSFEGSLIWKWLLRDVKTYDDRMKVFQSLEGYEEGRKTSGKRLRYVPEKDREEIFENYFRILSDEPWLNCTDIKHCTALEYQLLAEKIWADMAFVLPAFEHALLYSDKSAFVAVYYLNVDMKFDLLSQIEYPIPGAGHAEDIMFMLDVPSMELKLNGKSTSLWEILHSPPSNPYRPEEYMYHMVDIFVNHWASIIKHGHPASPWPQFEREYKHFVEWTNNATHAIEKVHSQLPPTIKFMIDTYGSLGSSATVISSSLFALFLALLF